MNIILSAVALVPGLIALRNIVTDIKTTKENKNGSTN